ncbi:MAG: TrpR-like protein YerC/YecD [Eubacteriaceae bacterium]|nr:TrpR-like protein YerC/YecD [Eubacteriaceae bacterium]
MKKGKPVKGNNVRFYKAVLALDSEKACKMFFEDILTEAEMKAITQRLQIASLLDEKATFAEINRITGASSATITKINQTLRNGNKGFRYVLDRIKEEQ